MAGYKISLLALKDTLHPLSSALNIHTRSKATILSYNRFDFLTDNSINMYPTRIVLRPSQGHRVAKAVPSACRGMSSFFPQTASSFWGPSSRGAALSPFSGPNQDIFRLLDESARAFDNFPAWLNAESSQQQPRTFQPRFDVQEHEASYELRGELPGVEGKDLDVQFTDPTTLVIRGRTESSRTEGQAPKPVDGSAADATMSGALEDNATNATAAPEETEKAVSDTASVHSDSSYVQPTVEDDAPETASTLTGGANNEATPATSTVSAAAPAEDAAKQAASSEQAQPSSHYWLSERRTGSFKRTFTFPIRVDQDNVSASLRNGVLNITVPKAAVPEPRRISVL